MPAAVSLLIGPDQLVPEGTSHHWRGTLAEEDGSDLGVGAITAIEGWLDDPAGLPINSRTAVPLLNANGGTLVALSATQAQFTWQLDPADAVISAAGQAARVTRERHRLTLRFTFTRDGGGTGALTHEAYYDVASFARI